MRRAEAVSVVGVDRQVVLQKHDGFKSKGLGFRELAGRARRLKRCANNQSGGDHRPASDATASISISIFGLGSAWTTQVVRAG